MTCLGNRVVFLASLDLFFSKCAPKFGDFIALVKPVKLNLDYDYDEGELFYEP